jgi:hypothetical protein
LSLCRNYEHSALLLKRNTSEVGKLWADDYIEVEADPWFYFDEAC